MIFIKIFLKNNISRVFFIGFILINIYILIEIMRGLFFGV
jgi:hypothetical protein